MRADLKVKQNPQAEKILGVQLVLGWEIGAGEKSS
jgi:hypothetical protein